LNQADKKEVESQVALMGDIYRDAIKVRLWLGHEDEDIARVFAFFRTLAVVDKLVDAFVQELLLEFFKTATWSPIEQFLQRPWFSRRWVRTLLYLP